MLHWLAAHWAQARIVLGTRLAVLASLPRLRLIVIDEEHDPSYKQQEGLRYSARDLAVWRARQLGDAGRAGLGHAVAGELAPCADRAATASSSCASARCATPCCRRCGWSTWSATSRQGGLTSARWWRRCSQRLERGEQSLLFLNRRGYAPVLACDACGWISNCTRCTAFMVLHKIDRTGCAATTAAWSCAYRATARPAATSTCSRWGAAPSGVEEGLQAMFPAARILRIDADSTRMKGSAQAAFDTVHSGEVDILVGTQMVAKGHDFKKLTLVGILNPDTALFSQRLPAPASACSRS